MSSNNISLIDLILLDISIYNLTRLLIITLNQCMAMYDK